MLGVWLGRRVDVVMSGRWAAEALRQLVASALAGIVLSEIAVSALPGYSLTEPISRAPQWALAGLIAATAFRLGPHVERWIKRFFTGNKGGSPDA